MRLVPPALASLLLAAPAASAQEALPEGHSAHGSAFDEGPRQAAYLMESPGHVTFPVTLSKPSLAPYIEQGIAQLHGFWYFEAERTFRHVAAEDPDCAMAYWGMAEANVEEPERAAWFARVAWLKRGLASERERRYIDATARFYGVEGAEEPKGLVRPAAKVPGATEPGAAEPGAKVPAATVPAAPGTAASKPAAASARKAQSGEKAGAEKRPDKAAAERLVRDLEELVWDYPDDIEAKAFLANRIWLNREFGLPTTSRMSVEALLQDVFAVEPMHPAHHYRIHLWDSEESAARVVDSAVKCGPSWPCIAHNWHMGGHVFARLGRHSDAAYQQEASARVDHAYMMRDWVLPDQIHNFAHNNEWLTRSLRHHGRVREAVELAKNMIELPRHPKYNTFDEPGSTSYGRRRLLEVLELYEQWDEIVELCATMYLEPHVTDSDGAARAFALAKAHLHRGEAEEAAAQEDALEAMIAGARAERAAAVDAAEAEALAASQKSSDVAAAMAKALAEFDGELGGLRDMAAAVDDLRAVLAGEDVAKHLDALAKGRYEKAHLARLTLDAALAAEGERAEKLRASALERARAAVKGRDGQLYEHATLAHVLWSLGEREEALEAFDALRAHSARADLDLPVFRRLAPLAEARGLAADWRPEDVPAVDVGERIALDELGPAYWMPPKAPEWSLPDAFGERHTLASYRGRPVLVVFFLGFGCVHCVEQLQALAPRAGEFAERGIDIVSIGLQSPEDLRVSIGDDPSDTGYPFPVLADPDLAQFKAYRAHDDFEGVALHGTYLVDGEGRVRWLDISHEPFMDVDFLLAESVRLLALPVRTPREARRSPEARAEPAAAETETGSRSGV